MKNQGTNRTKRIVYISLLVAQALIISIVEGMLPAPFGFAPGAKLGLANLISVIAIFTMKKREVALFISTRMVLQMLLGGTASTFLYSLGGSTLSLIFMYLAKSLGPKRVSIIGVSAVGGFFHNVGQLMVAALLIARNLIILNYLPVLSIIGILAGLFVGIGGNYLLTHVHTLTEAHLMNIEGNQSSWLPTLTGKKEKSNA
jgi:heptaprenyl diphosphate synthase